MNKQMIQGCITSLLIGLLCAVHTVSAMSAKDFFRSPDMVSAALSPSGNQILAMRFKHDSQTLSLISTTDFTELALLNVSELSITEAAIEAVAWIDDNHIAAQFVEKKTGVQDLLDTQKKRQLLVIKVPEKEGQPVTVLSVRTNGWLVEPLPQEPRKFLYAKSSMYSKVYKLDVGKLAPYNKKLNKLMKVDGGQFKKVNELASAEGFATRWFTNNAGAPAAVLYFNRERNLILGTLDAENSITELKTWTAESFEKDTEQRILPVALGPEPNTFYCLNIAEEEERTVYQVNYETGEQSVVYESDSYKIVDLIVSGQTGELAGVKVLDQGEIRDVYFNLIESSNVTPSKIKETLIDEHVGKGLQLFYSESHSAPGKYVLHKQADKSQHIVGSVFPHLPAELASVLVEGEVNVDGITVPYLLSLPEMPKSKQAPLIVMPHGGPIGIFDTRYFNMSTQYLVAQGFAVLRVNFRGSGGISKDLKEAGKKQYGDLMLEDIHQSTLKVMARGDINSEKVCAVGMSYGGYAATMLTIKHPNTYKCAVNVAGISDLNLFLNRSELTKAQREWGVEHIGDPVSEHDKLKSISSVYNASKLNRPILIAHGAKDDVVDVEHAYRLKLALEKYNKPYEWHINPEGEHNFGDAQEEADLYQRIVTFVEASM